MSKTLEEQKQSLVEKILDFILDLDPKPVPIIEDDLREKFHITVGHNGSLTYWYNFFCGDVCEEDIIFVLKISACPRMFYPGYTYNATLYSDGKDEDLVASVTKPTEKIKKAHELAKEFRDNCRDRKQLEKIEGIESKIKELIAYYWEN